MDEKKKKKPTKGSARALAKLFHDPNFKTFISNQLKSAQKKHPNGLRKSSKNGPGGHYAAYCLWSGIHPEQMINPDENSSEK